jgi:hypothetical protein
MFKLLEWLLKMKKNIRQKIRVTTVPNFCKHEVHKLEKNMFDSCRLVLKLMKKISGYPKQSDLGLSSMIQDGWMYKLW